MTFKMRILIITSLLCCFKNVILLTISYCCFNFPKNITQREMLSVGENSSN